MPRACAFASLPWIAFGLVALLVASPAFAQQSDVDAEAQATFQAGLIAYEAGRYQSALDNFERAYELSQRPALLYNVGLAAERLRNDARAVSAYERFLVEVPDAPNADQVRARLDVLRRSIAEREETERRLREATVASPDASPDTSPEAASEAPSEAPPESSSGSAARISLLVGGGALLAGAAVTTGFTVRVANESEECGRLGILCANRPALAQRRNALLGTSIGLGVVGAAALVTGLLVGGDGGDSDETAFACVPAGLGVVCDGRF
jgi:tetratricopeptide (TPR) repeat protein